MIAEDMSKIPITAGFRLSSLLRAKEEEENNFASAISALKIAHKEVMDRVEFEIHRLREEILTGQIPLIDVLEASHSEPMSKENGRSE